MKPSSKRIAAVAATIALLGLAYVAVRPAPLEVEVAPVTRGPLTVTVDDEGETRVRNRFVVSAPVAGKISRIELRAGDPVEADQVFATLDPVPLDPRERERAEAALATALDNRTVAQAARDQARDALEQARRDAHRAENLFEQQIVSREAVEHARLDVTTRTKELEAAEYRALAAAHEVEEAEAALRAGEPGRTGNEPLALQVPITGRVLSVPEQSARVVAAGETLIEVGRLDDLEIVVDFLSTDAVKIRPGNRMLVRAWGGDRVLEGRVRTIEPSGFTKVSALGIDEQRVNVIGDFAEDPAPLGDRYRIEASVVVWHGDDVLQVPWSALFRADQEWAAFVVEGGRARLRTVEAGHRGALTTEIVSGLDAGQRVIRHPTDRIADGVRVRTKP